MGGFQGQASDIEIQSREIMRLKKELNEIISKHTGQPMDQVVKDTDRDYYMTAAEAVEYGLVDEVVARKPATPGT
jgi:ATP-dependent Clp protease protease subunit